MGSSYRHGNYCKRCEAYCFDEDYCESCKEHIMECSICGEDMDKSNLASVSEHEHKGLNTDINVVGKKVI